MGTGWYAFTPDPGRTVAIQDFLLEVEFDPGRVWRVGYRPDPWAWTPWQYANGGRFDGRWDDPAGEFRTVYAGASLVGCLLEVLAPLRPEPGFSALLDAVEEDPVDADEYPTGEAG